MGATASSGLSSQLHCSPPGCKPTKATMMSLRERIANHASNVSLQAVMAKGRGLWQRSSTNRGSSANNRPKQPADYPKFIKTDGEWGNQFDMALLAWELDSQQALAGVTTPHRRLISVDLRPGLVNTEGGTDHRMRVHLPPDINGTDHHAVAPHQIIRPEDVQLGDVVIGLTADWHWWCTVPVELAASEMYGAAQNGGVADAIQADHTLLVAQVESFMSAQEVTKLI